MEQKKHFEKYYSKLRLEAFVKSLLAGLAVGFTANFIAAFATWFTTFNGLWLSLGILLGVTLITTPLFYLKHFRPTVTNNARRLDRLGLEERLITMVEYENDDSYIASAQRRDAKAALDSVDAKSIKLTVSFKMLIIAPVCTVLGTAMTIITALSSSGILPRGDELIDHILPDEPEIYISVTYDVEEGGYIEGEADQLILVGANTTQVIAVADDGYAFSEWSDGYAKPYRTDKEVMEELEVFAIFEQTGEGDGEGDGEGEGQGEGDGDSAAPGNGEGQGEGNGEGEGEGEGENPGGTTGGGKYAPNNQIIDGERFYREVLDRESLIEYLEEHGDELSEEERAIIESYIEIV